MIKGFKDFLLRGNIVDLAVAFVIGTAFATVVASFGKAFITPILNSIPGSKSDGLGFSLRGGALEASTKIDLSLIINALIVFVITAAILYFLFIVPMNHLAERRKAGIEPEVEAPSEEILLLQEIRDALVAQSPGGGGTHRGTSSDPLAP